MTGLSLSQLQTDRPRSQLLPPPTLEPRVGPESQPGQDGTDPGLGFPLPSSTPLLDQPVSSGLEFALGFSAQARLAA